MSGWSGPDVDKDRFDEVAKLATPVDLTQPFIVPTLFNPLFKVPLSILSGAAMASTFKHYANSTFVAIDNDATLTDVFKLTPLPFAVTNGTFMRFIAHLDVNTIGGTTYRIQVKADGVPAGIQSADLLYDSGLITPISDEVQGIFFHEVTFFSLGADPTLFQASRVGYLMLTNNTNSGNGVVKPYLDFFSNTFQDGDYASDMTGITLNFKWTAADTSRMVFDHVLCEIGKVDQVVAIP